MCVIKDMKLDLFHNRSLLLNNRLLTMLEQMAVHLCHLMANKILAVAAVGDVAN